MSTKAQDEANVNLKAAIEIFATWGVSREDASRILGERIYPQDEVVKRALLVQDIDFYLDKLFENPNNIQEFMSMPNDNAYFMGKTPIEVISDGKLDSLEGCVQRLRALSFGF